MRSMWLFFFEARAPPGVSGGTSPASPSLTERRPRGFLHGGPPGPEERNRARDPDAPPVPSLRSTGESQDALDRSGAPRNHVVILFAKSAPRGPETFPGTGFSSLSRFLTAPGPV